MAPPINRDNKVGVEYIDSRLNSIELFNQDNIAHVGAAGHGE